MLPDQESVGQNDLQESLKVKRKKGQTKKHAKKDQEKDSQDERKVQREHGKREEIVDPQAIGY
jgi:hypothetical protein